MEYAFICFFFFFFKSLIMAFIILYSIDNLLIGTVDEKNTA